MILRPPLVQWIAFLVPLCASAQITITMPGATGQQCVNNAYASTSLWAQTFTTPDATNTRLDSFQLLTSNYVTTNFATYVVQWNTTANAISGAPLWTS